MAKSPKPVLTVIQSIFLWSFVLIAIIALGNALLDRKSHLQASDTNISSPVAAPPAKAASDLQSKDSDASQPIASMATKSVFDDSSWVQWVVQLGAYKEQDTVNLLLTKLQGIGIPAYTEPFDSPQGPRTRVRAGPFVSQDVAEEARSKIRRIIGVDGPVLLVPMSGAVPTVPVDLAPIPASARDPVPTPPVSPDPSTAPDPIPPSSVEGMPSSSAEAVPPSKPRLRPWFGMRIRAFSGGQGLAATAVEKNGPAYRSGIRANDMLTSINGTPVGLTSIKGPDYLSYSIETLDVIGRIEDANPVSVTIYRGGRTFEVTVQPEMIEDELWRSIRDEK